MMEYFHNNVHHEYEYEKSLESVLQRCESTCNDMITYVINRPDVHNRGLQLNLLRDCLQICISTSIFLSAKSQFTKENVKLCAKICELCGNECMKFTDYMSQDCGKECLYCANACKTYLTMLNSI